ncbi:hypothetical protein, partial [Algiphilus sp.]|uniref:hypothetical protein n=1 Tax=Algiphilus sp. TaxID=1872431 RepID=UPI003C4DB00F
HEQDDDDESEDEDGSRLATPLLRDEPTDEQMDPELEFLRQGKFAFFLDDGDTRVRVLDSTGRLVAATPD